MGGKQKSRFDGIDVLAMTSYIQGTLLGHKVVNIYDGANSSTVMFKLASTAPKANSADGSTGEAGSKYNKVMLLLESGIRFNVCDSPASSSSDNKTPGAFAMKLRKHIRGTRLEGVKQLGVLDRVVDFRFGSGDRTHHLILELYSSGNIILTDSEYKIVSLLRTHNYQKGDESNKIRVAVHEIYPVTYATTIESDTPSTDETSLLHMDGESALKWCELELGSHRKHAEEMLASAPKQKRKQKKAAESYALTLKILLLKQSSGVHYFGPSLIEHCILCAGLDPQMKIVSQQSLLAETFQKLVKCLNEEGLTFLRSLESNVRAKDFSETSPVGGYILYREKEQSSADLHAPTGDDANRNAYAGKLFQEFQPHLLRQHHGTPYLTFPSFNDAVDKFFSLIEDQRQLQKAEAAERSAKERLEKIRRDQEKRIEGLLEEQEKMKREATLVETFATDIDNALLVINSALDNGMDWDDLESLVEYEKKENQNPVAMLITRLNLKNDTITLTLPDPDTEDKIGGVVLVDVTVSRKISAHANARAMFAQTRQKKEKSDKTIEASLSAMKAAEVNTTRQLQESKSMKDKIKMVPARKQFWWEKFNWFITSDNYLVIGGRDAQQNEVIVKRYLRPGDAYLHADVHGAASCILRAKRQRDPNGASKALPLSEQALREAGTFTICKSSAWASKMVTSAWWVDSHQVSKTAPTGEYLTVGSFMVRGKKNFLPPSQLEMGLAIFFRLGDDASIGRHAIDRRDFALVHAAEDIEMKEDEEDFFEEEVSATVIELSARPEALTPDDDSKIDIEIEDKEDSIVRDKASRPGTIEDAETEAIAGDVIDGKDRPAKPKERKGLSARQRKDIKKYGSLEAAEKAAAARAVEEKKNAEKRVAKATKASSSENKPTETARVKRSKKKRLEKYADQDDEDRELALLALYGSSKDKGKGKKKGSSIIPVKTDMQLKAASDAKAVLLKDAGEIAKRIEQPVREILELCVRPKAIDIDDDDIGHTVRWDKFDADVLEQLISLNPIDAQKAAVERLHEFSLTSRIDNYSASLSGILRTIESYGYKNLGASEQANGDGKQRKTKAQKIAEKEAWKELLAEDGVVETDNADEDDVIDDTVELAKLTGKPLKEDALLSAVPVCAPYMSLSNYKYRIKLTPGTQKRGRASKQCVEMFLNNSSDFATERDLIKFVGDNEWVQAMCGDVKIAAAGANKVAKQMKNASKKSKKKKKK